MRLPPTAPTLMAILLLASYCSPTAAGQSPAASPTGTTATPLALQPSDGEQRVRRPTPGALSSITVPFILKVDERNGHAEDFVLLTEDIPPGQAIPAHYHPHSEEILFIHAGHGTAWLNGREAKLGPGTIIFMPRNTGARLLNDGTEPISLVAIFSRQGFDKFLRDVSVPAGEVAKPLSAEDLAAILARHRGAVILEKK
jgi:quercetin dioxygenase-like cupin family protein